MARSFGQEAGAYDRARPEYPAEAVEWLVGSARRVADVGAGTGKLTRGLLASGREVVAVEPDEKMRDTLSAALPEVECLAGSAEDLPLADDSVEAVTFGQAWHWVDPPAACREAARVLTPEGVLGLVWNVRDPEADWVAEMTRIIRISNGEAMAALATSPPFTAPFSSAETRRWTWSRTLTREAVLDLVRSRSYYITAPPDEQERILDGMRTLLATHPALADRDDIEMPYVTIAWRVTR